MEKLDPEFKKKWVAALRSGEYKQGKNMLYNSFTSSYCCIGVAGVILGAKTELMDGAQLFSYKRPMLTSEEKWIAPPARFPKSLLISNEVGQHDVTCLSTMNDDGKSFSKIADYIEENL